MATLVSVVARRPCGARAGREGARASAGQGRVDRPAADCVRAASPVNRDAPWRRSVSVTDGPQRLARGMAGPPARGQRRGNNGGMDEQDRIIPPPRRTRAAAAWQPMPGGRSVARLAGGQPAPPAGAAVAPLAPSPGAQLRNLPLLQLVPGGFGSRPAGGRRRAPLAVHQPGCGTFCASRLPSSCCRQRPAGASGRVFAPGPGTASALAGHGITPVQVPTGSYDSEGILDLPGLAGPLHDTVALVGAPHGRGMLAPALRERGARVYALHVYRRLPARLPARRLASLPRLRAGMAAIASSARMLEQLVQVLPPAQLRHWRDHVPLLLASQRLADLAIELGFRHVHVAGSAMTADLQAALLRLAGAGGWPAHGR